MSGPIRAYIQYNCIAHYRRRIFELLSANKDVQFTIIADSESDTPFLKVIDDTICNIRQRIVKTKEISIGSVFTLFYQPEALKIVAREKPDIIIALANPYSLTAWGLLILGRFMKIPILLWGHGLLENESGPKWWIRGLLYRLAAGHLLYGDYAKKLLINKGFNENTLYVVYNSLDYDTQNKVAEETSQSEIKEYQQSLGIRDGQGLVVFTGRLQPVKRLDLLLHAICILAKEGKEVHVALVGHGSEKKNLESLAREGGIEYLVHFLGESYDERYLGLVLSASDLCVIPSGAGLSIMHAMVYGTPVLLHNRLSEHFPEWEAVEDGVTGFFYEYGDIDDLTAKIKLAISSTRTKARMSEACKAIIRDKYNPHRQVEVFVRAVKEVIEKQRKWDIDLHKGTLKGL
jgi:glycosyltransferase involved in cell wall biosynthesis